MEVTNVVRVEGCVPSGLEEFVRVREDGFVDLQECCERLVGFSGGNKVVLIGYFYSWVYHSLGVDFIRWQVREGVFNWEECSFVVVRYAVDLFDRDRYNWERFSSDVVKFAPQLFDKDRYNWRRDSWAVAQYAPQYFDPSRYNWRKDSWAVSSFQGINFFDWRQVKLSSVSKDMLRLMVGVIFSGRFDVYRLIQHLAKHTTVSINLEDFFIDKK